MAVIRFEANEPRMVALKYADGKEVDSQFGGTQVLFTTTDGDTMYLPPIAADQIDQLGVRPGQPIEITKVKLKQGKKDVYRWTVERAEGARPEQRTPATATALSPDKAAVTTQHSNGSALAAVPSMPEANGEYAASLMLLEVAGRQAVDAVARVQAYAKAKLGAEFAFTEEDVAKIWMSMFIQGAKNLGGASSWKH